MTKAAKSTGAIMDQLKDAVDGEATEIPTVTPVDEQELALFAPPNPSQWRRKLNEHELLAWVAMQANMRDESNEAVGLSMFAQVAMADTIEEVLGGKVETTKSREILDTVVACHSIKFINSDKDDGCPYFGIVDVRHGPTNESETLSLGGWMAVAQLAQLHYRTVELPADSTYLVPENAPGAIAKESYPHYFKIKQKPTPKGHMNYLAPALS